MRVCVIFCARSGTSFSPHLMRAFIRHCARSRLCLQKSVRFLRSVSVRSGEIYSTICRRNVASGKMMICRSFWTIRTVFITISAMTAHRKLILPRRLSHIGQQSACRKNRKKPKNMTKMRNRRKNPSLGQIFMKRLCLRVMAADIISSVRCSSKTAEVHTPI